MKTSKTSSQRKPSNAVVEKVIFKITDDGIFTDDGEEFDLENIAIDEPETQTFGKGAQKISVTSSKGYYLDENEKKRELYIVLPPQQCFGFSLTHDLKIADSDRTNENANGVQICYPMTSMKTVAEPFTSEQNTMTTLTDLWNKSVEHGRVEAKKKGEMCKLPRSAVNSFKAVEDDDYTEAIKFPFAPATTEGTIDATKPKRWYIKLLASNKDSKKLTISTNVYYGDDTINVLDYLNSRGIIEPCVRWNGIYWGAHGSKGYGGSLQFKVVEANFTPIESKPPTGRFIRPSRGTDETPNFKKNIKKQMKAEDDDSSKSSESDSEESTPKKKLIEQLRKKKESPKKGKSKKVESSSEEDEPISSDEEIVVTKGKGKSKPKKVELKSSSSDEEDEPKSSSSEDEPPPPKKGKSKPKKDEPPKKKLTKKTKK